VKRRQFIVGLGSTAAWPLAARAQEGQRMRRLGALTGGAETEHFTQSMLAAFRQRLSEIGWIEGRNLQIDLRWAAGDRARAQDYASELVGLRPDVLFGDRAFAVTALLAATRTLPIVFTGVTNPIRSGFVNSLARPGGNVTGFADSEPESLAKLPEFVKRIAPQVSRVAILGGVPLSDPSEFSTMEFKLRLIETAASSLGLRTAIATFHDTKGLEDAIRAFSQESNGALIFPGDSITALNLRLLLALALRNKLPTVTGYRAYIEGGGLLSYGTKSVDQFRRAAEYVDRILKGARPEELPVQLPIQFELVINLATAKALDLTLPPTLLAIADEVIE
jgi:putative ABC transport system substrate-binding protein